GDAARDPTRRDRLGLGRLRRLPGCARAAGRRAERRGLHRPLRGTLPGHGTGRRGARGHGRGAGRHGGPRARRDGRGRARLVDLALTHPLLRRRHADPGCRTGLAGEGGAFVAALAPGWDRLVLRLPASAATRSWQDRNVAEIAAGRGTAPVDTFCDLVLADDLAGQWGVVMMNG